MVSTKIAVIGLGYVGLPLAIELCKKYSTVGFDKNRKRVSELNRGVDNTLEISENEFKDANNLKYTTNINDIADCNVYIISVPTPIDKYNVPDLSPLASASKMVGSILKKDDVVIYESTVYPGATEEFCVPILETTSNLKYNADFFCGYSPERVNPGDKEHSLTTIVKVTSGSNERTANFVDKLYNSIISAGTHRAPSIAVAEAAKVIENIQRDVNIALINELSMIFHKLGLETNKVLKAASTKWNFLPFLPGLVGGHCIGVDPYYLTHKAKEIGYHPEIILAGRRINDSMGKYIADSTIIEMAKAGINPVDATIAVLGITFKENCPDLRNTKVPDIIRSLDPFGCKIMVSDPYANASQVKNIYDFDLVDINTISDCDVIIVAVAHNEYKSLISENLINQLLKNNGVFIDVKGIASKELLTGKELNYWQL